MFVRLMEMCKGLTILLQTYEIFKAKQISICSKIA